LNFSEATDAVQFVPHGKSSGGNLFLRNCRSGFCCAGALCFRAGCLTFDDVSKERNAFILKDLSVI
jgi:hypothetical protein